MALRASYYGLKKRILDKVLGDYDTDGVMTNKDLTENNVVKSLVIEPGTGITINDVSYAKFRNGIVNAYVSFKNEAADITPFTNLVKIKDISGLKTYQMSLVGIDTTTNQPVACYCPYDKASEALYVQTRISVTANHNVVIMITAIFE